MFLSIPDHRRELSGCYLDSRYIEIPDTVQLSTGKIENINLLARNADRAFFQLRRIFDDREAVTKRLARIETRVKNFFTELVS